MLTRFLCVASSCLLVASCARTATEDHLAKVEALTSGVKTLEADMAMRSDTDAGEASRHFTWSGHFAMQVVEDAGGPARCLLNSRMKTTEGYGAGDEFLAVCDGDVQWTENRTTEGKTIKVYKGLADTGARVVMGWMLRFVKEYDLTFAGEGELDGERLWVFQGTLRPAGKHDGPWRSRLPDTMTVSVSPQDGVPRRQVTQLTRDNMKITCETRLTNVKVNGKLDPALFKYTPPEGADVTDLTKAPKAGGDAAGK